MNYLALAENRGAVIKTECEVVGIAKGEDGLWVVDCIDHLQAEKVQVRTKYLFLCAGSVHSTRLLAQWQASLPVGKQDPQLRANLGLGYFSNADALGMVYDTRDDAFPSWGPAITTATVHGQTPSDAPSRPWFMLQDGGYAASLDRLLGTLRGAVWMGRNRYKGSPRSGRPHPPRLATGEPPKVSGPAPRRDGNLPSPVDQLLDALGAGLWKEVLPGQIADGWKSFAGISRTPCCRRWSSAPSSSRLRGLPSAAC